MASNWPGPIILRLAGVWGAAMKIKSDPPITLSSMSGLTTLSTYGRQGMSSGSTPATRMPCAHALTAI